MSGDFTTVGGQTRNRLAAVDAATGAVRAWDPEPDDWVDALVVSGSTLYAGGLFSSIGGQPSSCLAAVRWPVTALAGVTRYDTAIAASRATFARGSCDSVIVATGRDYPDALAASGLAGAAQCPAILVNGAATTIDAKTQDEISRLISGHVSRTIYVCGGTAAVSAGIENRLKILYGAGSVTRLAGATRYSTAEAVAKRAVAVMPGHGITYGGSVYVVTGKDYHDAELAGPLACYEHVPILLVGPVDKALTDTLASIGATEAVIIGSTWRVPQSTQDALGAHLGQGAVTRPCAETDPYAQSVSVAEAWARWVGPASPPARTSRTRSRPAPCSARRRHRCCSRRRPPRTRACCRA